MSVASIAPAKQVDATMRASAEIAAVSPAGSSDTTGMSTSLAKLQSAGVPGPAIAPSAAMPQATAENVAAANVGPPLDLTARSLRARRVSADRKGDPNGGNVFDHLRQFGRAFADIPPAKQVGKRIEKQGRTKSASATPASSGVIRPESHRRCRRCPGSERPRRIHREKKGLHGKAALKRKVPPGFAGSMTTLNPCAGTRNPRCKACYGRRRPVARVVELPADRVDALYRRDVRKHAAAAPGNHIEFEPGDVFCRCARRAGDNLAHHRAAVAQLPGRARKMTADNLVVRNERCDRLPESPGQLAVRAGLAFVLLRAYGVRREHDGFAGRRDSVGKSGLGGR
jgi:hypothetical protein